MSDIAERLNARIDRLVDTLITLSDTMAQSVQKVNQLESRVAELENEHQSS